MIEDRRARDDDQTHLDNEKKAVIEQAIDLKNQENDMVTVIAAGCDTDRVLLREALAMGCDRAWLIARNSPDVSQKPPVSVDMEKLIRLNGYDVILTGYRMKSGLFSFLGAELAELLSLGQMSCASKLERKNICSKENPLVITDIRYGNEFLQMESTLPCVVTLANYASKNEIVSVAEILGSLKKELMIWKDKELDGLKAGDDRVQENYFSDAITIAALQKSEKRKDCAFYDEISVEEAVEVIIENLCQQNIIEGICL